MTKDITQKHISIYLLTRIQQYTFQTIVMSQSFELLHFQPLDGHSSVTITADPLSPFITGCTNSKPMELPDGFEPRDLDVLCGRGRGVWDRAGNRRFKEMIQTRAPKYAVTRTKVDKGAIVASIVDKMRDEGALFVKKDTKTQSWYDIGEYQAREKTSHAIRDHLNKGSGSRRIENQKSRRGTITNTHVRNRKGKNTQQSTIASGSATQQQSTQSELVSSLCNISSAPPSRSNLRMQPRRVSVDSMPTSDLVETLASDFELMNGDSESWDKSAKYSPTVEWTTGHSPRSNSVLLEAASSFLQQAQAAVAHAEAVIRHEVGHVDTTVAKVGQEPQSLVHDEDSLPWSELFPVAALQRF